MFLQLNQIDEKFDLRAKNVKQILESNNYHKDKLKLLTYHKKFNHSSDDFISVLKILLKETFKIRILLLHVRN